MKKSFFVVLFLLITNFSYALSTLPKYAYLRYGDNQKEVLTLQLILNSDSDTKITDTGVGSPGHETWYFGKLTEEALKSFQEKYGLEITGQIDFKTWQKLNSYAIEGNSPISKPNTISNTKPTNTAKTTPTTKPVEEKNIFLDDSSYASSNENSPATQTTNTTSTFLDNSYLNDVLSKYSTLLSPSTYFSNTSQAQSTNTYTPANPYLTQPTSYAVQPISNYQAQPNPYLQSSYPSYSPYSSGGYSGLNSPGYYLSNQSGYYGSILSGNIPISKGQEQNSGQITGNVGDIGMCRATTFAHGTLSEGCVADSADQQNNQRAASGVIMSRVGVQAIPAVALPKRGNFGDAVEVKDLSTGKCKAFPLLDRGPGSGPQSKGVCIDLTGSAYDILKGNQPCKIVGRLGEGKASIPKVQYAIIPGEKIKTGEVKDCKHLAN